jgi:hypothetical protein
MRKYHQIILIGAFLALLFACLIGTVFGWDFCELQENRKLAEFPAFKSMPLDDWPSALEDYFNDNFGFRNTFIRRHNKLMRKLEKSKEVEFGKDGWLFLNFRSVMWDYLGRKQPDTGQLDRLATRLGSRIQWLKQLDIPYFLVIPPNKITVYPEYLPDPLPRMKGKTNRECFLEYFDGRFDDNLLNFAPILIAEKTNQVVYFKTDTHWNAQGAYISYSHLIDRINPLLPGLPDKIRYEDLNKEEVDHTGDLAIIAGLPDKYPMRSIATSNPEAANWTTTELTQAVFLKKEHMPLINKPPYTIHNPDGKYNALVFHDSFGGSWINLLPHHFKNTTFIFRYSTSELLQAAVENCKPDIVIEEVLERFFVEETVKGGAFADEVIPMQEQK